MMQIVENSARYARADNSMIDCLIEVDGVRLPYTTADGDPSTSAVWDALLAGEAGQIAEFAPSERTPDEVIEAFRVAIQSHVDETAIAKRYDSGNSLATYKDSTVPQWAAEAATFIAWRDAVWAYSYAELDKVLNAEREQPTVDAFLAELPAMVWPD